MLFSSAIFLFLFLPAVLLIYYLAPKKARNLILLLASLFFYTFGERKMVILIIISAIVDFIAGLLIKNSYRKQGLTISIFFNLGILFYFKYASFSFENITSIINYFGFENHSFISFSGVALPLGISFYTFQTMSYTIDVYRGNMKATSNFIDFATYVTLFPQLIAGPIVRYSNIYDDLRERNTSIFEFSEGARRFIIGLGKKMIIANNLAFVADGAFDLPSTQMTTSFAWIGALAYTFQIYFDFSGYSDMAIGLGKMFGFSFPENFNYPYISKSVREFWRRWHISLSMWFRDYLYFSLGGNRISTKRTYLNLIIVFFLTGIWHGAEWNFVIWGLWHGLFLIIERNITINHSFTLKNYLKNLYLLFIVIIGWVVFRSNNLEAAINYLTKMFIYVQDSSKSDIISFYLRKESLFAFVVAILLSTPLYEKMKFFVKPFLKRQKYFLSAIEKFFLCFIFFISCMYISVDAYNPFIYFRF